MDIQKIILQELRKKSRIKSSEIVKLTGFSREYVNRFLKKLREKGEIILIGKANQAHYVLNNSQEVFKTKKNIRKFRASLQNKNLSEDEILQRIKLETGIFLDLPKNIIRILDYSFLEMLNNAIEHSSSKIIRIDMNKHQKQVDFSVRDLGVGIFKNIQKKKKLKNELEAVQDLLKGKQTTMPKQHSGQGIFFTSKLASTFYIQSSNRILFFNNNIPDIFLLPEREIKGTRVVFSIFLNFKKKIKDVFDEYSDNDYEFNKTKIHIKLYKLDTDYISRSQARRVLVGLDKFKVIILDFKNVETVGQAFADEIFRVWKKNYPQIKFQVINSNENINFMIKRAQV